MTALTLLILFVFSFAYFESSSAARKHSFIQVRCYPNTMNIELNGIPFIKNKQFRLIDRTCREKESKSKLKFLFSIYECGTRYQQYQNYDKYTNIIYPIVPDLSCPFFRIKASCAYMNSNRVSRSLEAQSTYEITLCDGSISQGPPIVGPVLTKKTAKGKVVTKDSRNKKKICPNLIGIGERISNKGEITSAEVVKRITVKPKPKGKCVELTGNGDLHVSMNMYTNASYEEFLKDQETRKQKMSAFNDVFYEVSLQSNRIEKDLKLKLKLQRCYATPSDNPEDLLQYTLLDDKCPIDPTFQYYDTDLHDKVRFSVKSFLFVRSNSQQFFMHCEVKICEVDDPLCNVKCDQKPPLRARRSLTRWKRREVENDERYSLVCKPHHFEIILKKPLPLGVFGDNLQLYDPSCRANENSTHFIFASRLHDCGTLIDSDSNYIYFKNAVIQTFHNVIYRERFFKLPLSCKYRMYYQHGPIRIEYTSNNLRLKSQVFGTYNVDIAIYTDSNYTKRFPRAIVEVDPSKDLYFEVSIISKYFNLALFLETCYGEPTATYYNERYTFIQDGCGIDESLNFIATNDPSVIRFQMKPFTFDREYSNVKVNCLVSACSASTGYQTKCSRGCQNNVKA